MAMLLLLGALLAAGEGSYVAAGRGAVVTRDCDKSSFGDPAQRFGFDRVPGERAQIGQITTSFGAGGKKCVAVKGCGMQADGEVVLTSCMDTNCTSWTLEKPPYPPSDANGPSTWWLVAPGSPNGQPRCLENPKRSAPGSTDIFCCSGVAARCGSTYKTALPWQQWALASNGQIQNQAGDLCLSVTPPPPPPLQAAPVWPLPQYMRCQPDQDSEVLLSSSVVVQLTGAASGIASEAAARLTPLLRAAGARGGKVATVTIALQSGSEALDQRTNYSYSLSWVALGSSGDLAGSAASPYGVGYMLETLLQLAQPAAQAHCGSGFVVHDHPDYVHRCATAAPSAPPPPPSSLPALLCFVVRIARHCAHPCRCTFAQRSDDRHWAAILSCGAGGEPARRDEHDEAECDAHVSLGV
jgi:hypothetical protein